MSNAFTYEMKTHGSETKVPVLFNYADLQQSYRFIRIENIIVIM